MSFFGFSEHSTTRVYHTCGTCMYSHGLMVLHEDTMSRILESIFLVILGFSFRHLVLHLAKVGIPTTNKLKLINPRFHPAPQSWCFLGWFPQGPSGYLPRWKDSSPMTSMDIGWEFCCGQRRCSLVRGEIDAAWLLIWFSDR